MKITTESTDAVVELVNPVTLTPFLAQIWEGTTDSGILVICYITRIDVPKGQDVSQFEAELCACRPPSTNAQKLPRRLVL